MTNTSLRKARVRTTVAAFAAAALTPLVVIDGGVIASSASTR